jgi:type II secretory pathway component PulJ
MRQNSKKNSCSGLRREQSSRKAGFTLAEAISTLVIAAMIMIAAIGIYMGVRRSEAAIEKRLESGFSDMEILQRITEDIDRLALPGSGVAMSIKNKTELGGYKSAQMIIESKIYDKDNKPQVFEKIVWQSRADPDANGLIIYRAHSGYTLEDKMLDEPKEKYEREWFIPICSGVTVFSVEAVSGGNVSQVWENQGLPQAVQISISFAEPQQDLLGNLTVPQEAIKAKTIVIDRFRQLAYQFIYKEFLDPNRIADVNDQNVPPEPNKLDAYEESQKEPNEISERISERSRR